ncbi:MAG: hypothetical protein IJJ28_07620 [Lentisphaeria bacterium]|nr:hypothetical protein [Lentisphaeria bacterium]
MDEPSTTPIRIQERDGRVTQFNVMELQTRLIGAFLASGRRDASYLAEEIALAVEYTLSRLPRPEPLFARGELEAAVIRLLEETSLPEVARVFRKGGAVETTTRITADKGTLRELLRRFFCGSDDRRFERLLEIVLDAAKKLDIADASPHLWLELARHYDALLEPEPGDTAAAPLPLVTLTRDELRELLPETAKAWSDAGILRINGVTSLFPCIHFFFMISDFARYHRLSVPVTELEIEPLLYQVGTVFEEIRGRIEKRLDSTAPLPCLLDIPDMFDFITDCAGGARIGSESLAVELAGTIKSGLSCDLYKLSIG